MRFRVTEFVYRRYGHRSCILKGQGNALMYPDPYMRASGDIDQWIVPNDGETVEDIMRLCRRIDPNCKLQYHHAELTDDGSTPWRCISAVVHGEFHLQRQTSEVLRAGGCQSSG